MPTIEERVAFLEGRVTEHSRGVDGLREAVSSLEARMDRRFEAVDHRFESLEARVHSFEERVDRRFEGVERRLDGVDRRLDDLDAKLTRYFVWIIGIVITSLTAMVAALATIAAKI